MFKNELADELGVSVETLLKWMRPLLPKLREHGYYDRMKVLSPRLVEIILNHLDATEVYDNRPEKVNIGEYHR